MTPEQPIIQLTNASIYQGHSLILADVNITVNKGEFVYLIGKTGTGEIQFVKDIAWRFTFK